MSQEKKKTLSYRRAEFLIPGERTLEDYLTQAHVVFPNVYQRRVEVPGHPVLEGRRHHHQGGIGILLHIAAYTPGEHASIVPRVIDEMAGEVVTTPPPKDCEFMDGDIMVLVSGDHVLLCATNLHEKRAERFMIGLIEAAGFEPRAAQFSLCRKANVDKMRLIRSQGVRSLNLGVSLFEATLDRVERTTVKRRLGGGLMDEVRALLFKDQELQEIDAAENLSAEIVLKFDSRRKDKLIGRQRIETLAAQMIEDGEEEGFTIETMEGETIKGSDISLRKTVSLPKHAKSVYCTDAWHALETYYLELQAGGLLEQ